MYIVRTFFERRSKAFIWVFCGILVLAVLSADRALGPRPNSSLLSLIPIVIITATLGLWPGIFLSLVATVGSFVMEATWDLTRAAYVGAVVRLFAFILFVLLVVRLKEAILREELLSKTDALTGLYNRRYFNELAVSRIDSCRETKRPITLAFMDIDNFKAMNDRFGHDAGDELLKTAASLFRKHLDLTADIARIGGDEFAFLVPDETAAVVERSLGGLRSDFSERMHASGWSVSLSIGVVTFATAPCSLDDMMSHADSLMYSAKHGGKDDVKFAVVGGTGGERMMPDERR